MIEPLKYRRNTSEPIGKLMVNVTPDGWVDTQFIPSTRRLLSAEISEETKVIHEMIKQCPTVIELRKYFNKHGKQIRSDGADPTMAFTVVRDVATYNFEATGPYLEVFSYRNKKEEGK